MNLRRDVFQAIADPTRRAVLILLATQPMTAGAIATNFDSARPTISKHIRVLAECGLVQPHQKGREIYYEVNASKMNDIEVWLQQFRTTWENRFSKLDTVLETIQKKER